MGKKPLRECAVIGCHALTRERYCATHQDEKTTRHRVYDACIRDQKAAAFYKSKAWRRARAESIRRHHGLCQDCLAAGRIRTAEMVHHVKPLRECWNLALVQSNLRPLCNRCHGKYEKVPPGVEKKRER